MFYHITLIDYYHFHVHKQNKNNARYQMRKKRNDFGTYVVMVKTEQMMPNHVLIPYKQYLMNVMMQMMQHIF